MRKTQKLNLRRSEAQGKSDAVEEDEARQGKVAPLKKLRAKESKEMTHIIETEVVRKKSCKQQ